VHLDPTQLTPDVAAAIRAGGVGVHTRSADDEDAPRRSSSLAVPWVRTDEPERALAFRRGLG